MKYALHFIGQAFHRGGDKHFKIFQSIRRSLLFDTPLSRQGPENGISATLQQAENPG